MEAITMIRTNDGKLHKTEEDAKEYVADKCREVLANQLTGLTIKYPWFKHSHMIEIVGFLYKDYDKILKFTEDLNKTME